jgi:hypothetical protein
LFWLASGESWKLVVFPPGSAHPELSGVTSTSKEI